MGVVVSAVELLMKCRAFYLTSGADARETPFPARAARLHLKRLLGFYPWHYYLMR